MNRHIPSFFDKQGLQLLLFGGKGGVGKTTCATAAALRLAAQAPERSLLLVSTDPAHSVRDSLAGYAPPGNLQVLELDAQQCLNKFREQNGGMLREIAAAGTFLDDEDINQFLNLSLPGLDELMALFEIASWVETRQYDCIVVDTAPSGHTLRLLAMPELIGRWLGMLEVLLAKRRYMRRVFSRDATPDRLDQFVSQWKSTLHLTEKLMHDPERTEFVPVAIAEPLSVSETVALFHELQSRKMPVSELVVNQLHLECAPDPATADRYRPSMHGVGHRAAGRGSARAAVADGVLGPRAAGWQAAGDRHGPRQLPRAGGLASASSALGADAVHSLCRQGWRGQDDALLRDRDAHGPRLSRQAGAAVFRRPGPLALRLPANQDRSPAHAVDARLDGDGDRRQGGV